MRNKKEKEYVIHITDKFLGEGYFAGVGTFQGVTYAKMTDKIENGLPLLVCPEAYMESLWSRCANIIKGETQLNLVEKPNKFAKLPNKSD